MCHCKVTDKPTFTKERKEKKNISCAYFQSSAVKLVINDDQNRNDEVTARQENNHL